MRGLNKKQKKILMKLFINEDVSNTLDMTIDELMEIYEVNPHETFDTNVDRFLHDLYQGKEV